MHFLRIYWAFAAGYLLSYLFRTVTAVISPDLTRELDLDPSSLGLLTSAYFLAFAATQIPVGILLDRYGPRRVEPVLLLVAAAGAALFATAHTITGLTLARALIGAGVSACLMAPLKAFAAWYPPERQPSYGGWIMVAGGVGALASTVPVELALRVSSWRMVFVALAAVTAAAALFIYLRVPDIEKPAHTGGWRAQAAGVRAVMLHPRFWWIAPLGAMAMGSFMAIQGLWAVPWMMEVQGMSRARAADHLLAMSVVTMAGYLAIAIFGTRLARRGIHASHLFGGGFALNLAALAMIELRLPGSFLWWSLYGLGAASNVLGFTALNEGFPRTLAGRTSTTLNLMMFTGSFAVQWGIGVVADVARAAHGASTADGLRVAFAAVTVFYALALVWFLRGWKRYSRIAALPAAA